MSEKLPAGQSPSSVGATPGASGSVLSIVITGTTKGLKTAYAEATAMTSKFSHQMKEGLSGVKEHSEGMQESFKSWIAPLAAAATAFYGFHEVMEAFEKSETLANTSKALGVSTDKLQELNYAAGLSGSSAEEMSGALKKMTLFLNNAGQEGSTAADSLSKMGLSIKDLQQMTPDEALKAMSDGLSHIDDQGQKSALMLEIFGRNSGRLTDLLGDGSQKMEELGAEARKLGVVLSSVDIAKQMDAKDAMEKLKATFESLTAHLATKLSPVIKWISDGITEWMSDADGFSKTFDAVADGVVTAIGVMKMTWQGLQLLWYGAKAAIGEIGVVFYEVAKGIQVAADKMGQFFSKTWDAIKADANFLFTLMKTGWYGVKDSAITVFAEIVKASGAAVQTIGKGLSYISSNLGKATEEAGQKMVDYAGSLQGAASEELAAAGNALKNSASELAKARDALTSGYAETDTKYFDNMIGNAAGFRDAAVEDMRDVSDAIKSQIGGNAITATWDAFRKKGQESIADVKKSADEMNKGRKIGPPEELIQEIEYMKKTEERHKAWALGMFKRDVDAHEKMDWVNKQSAEYNMVLIDEQKTAFEEFCATREARSAQYHQTIKQQAMQAQEELANMQSRTNDDWAAMQDKFNADRAVQEQQAADQNRMIWESGLMGKMEVTGQILDNLSVLMESKNKDMFEIGKAASIANTVMSTFEGAQKAYSSMAGIPIVGPALGAAAAAAAVAAGMVRVQNIQATSLGGGSAGGSGGGGGGASSATAASQPMVQQQQNITLVGSSFSSSQVRGMISAINANLADNVNLKAQVVEE